MTMQRLVAFNARLRYDGQTQWFQSLQMEGMGATFKLVIENNYKIEKKTMLNKSNFIQNLCKF